MISGILAFNGGRLDPVRETYHLGNGYRAYSPVLMRFTRPDSWSPFGAGGINSYAYCAGDPVNRSDPTGHMSWQAGLGIGLGILGILGAVFTGGASIAAAGSISAALAGASTVSLVVGTAALVADVTGIASAATEESNPKVSAALGWTSLAFGILSLGIGFGARAFKLGKIPQPGKYKIIRLGLMDNFLNVRALGRSEDANGMIMGFRYEDRVKGLRRLNIVSHGNPPVSGIAQGTLTLNNWPREAEEVVNLLRGSQGVRFDDYHLARIIACNSAAGGQESFAYNFSQLTRLPTEGYKRDVAIVAHSDLTNLVHNTSNMILDMGKMPDDEMKIFDNLIEQFRGGSAGDEPQNMFPTNLDGYNHHTYYP